MVLSESRHFAFIYGLFKGLHEQSLLNFINKTHNELLLFSFFTISLTTSSIVTFPNTFSKAN